MEETIPCKWKSEEQQYYCWNSNVHIRKKKKDFKGYCKRQKGKYVMIKRLRRKYNNYK